MKFFSTQDAPRTWRLPEVPQQVKALFGEALIDRLVPKEATLVDSREQAEEILAELLASRALGVDCEGVSLGRWGRLCLCQVATPQKVYLFDTLREGVLEVLDSIFRSTSIVKVMHDCREDSSALLSQFDTELQAVFDSQVAHTMLLEQQAARPFQISLNELLKQVLKLENEQQKSLGQKMKDDPNVWFYRPMSEDLIAYAAQDVMYLLLLHRQLCDSLSDPSGGRVLMRSQRYVDYAKMNHHLKTPKAVERHGLRLQAMVATQTEAALYLKLNLGAHRQGVVSRPEALARFKDLQFGDIADCYVSAWNTGGTVMFLERLEPTSQSLPEQSQFLSGIDGFRKRRRPHGARS